MIINDHWDIGYHTKKSWTALKKNPCIDNISTCHLQKATLLGCKPILGNALWYPRLGRTQCIWRPIAAEELVIAI